MKYVSEREDITLSDVHGKIVSNMTSVRNKGGQEGSDPQKYEGPM